MIEGFTALYIFMLSAFTGYEVISRVPVILHTPLMSGSNFVHGIVLVGAIVAALIAARSKMYMAIFVGAFFLAGGIYMVYMVPSPTWFIVLDLVVAYIPMAWLGAKIAGRRGN